MKQEKKVGNLIGKTIKKTKIFYNSFCLIFEDDTFAIFVEKDYGGVCLSWREVWDIDELYSLGLLSKEEYKISKEYDEALIENRERKLLKKLKEKYE